MTEQNDQKPGFGWGMTVTSLLAVVAAIGFVCGYQSHAGIVKSHAEDFGKVKVQGHVYETHLVKSPYTPKTFTMAERDRDRNEPVNE